ncbi:helix-turn-helix domain-containing protein [Synergistaceae bacterium OttesenSCG-928-I11]|nr:helix-turn-helix domain-containing protein [Synergistaceae bacterium OttesenSCG-928-I11]
MSLGRRLRTLRKNMGFTQQKLADEVGVSRIYIQALESNRRMPSMKLLHRLSDSLQASITDIVDEYPNRAPRMQLEELLSNGEVDIWFRKRKLNDDELRRVERVINAVLDDWDEADKASKEEKSTKKGAKRPA